jgi:hypothetical protein
MKQRYGLDCIGYLTDSSIRWAKTPPPKSARKDRADEEALRWLRDAIAERQRESAQGNPEPRFRVKQSA